MKIKFFNNSLRSTAELDILIEKAINWLKKQGLTNLEWSTISADEPTKKDLEILYALGKKWKILNDAFYKKQIDKYLEEDCEICVFCHSPNGDELINVAEPTNVYKMVCCQCIIDSDEAWFYIRHELIHAFHQCLVNSGILNIIDNQDQRQQEAKVYYTGDNELKQQIEIENLQDVKANWHKIQPNKSITLVKLMLQTVVLLLTQLLGMLKKKAPKNKAYFIDYARQMARKYGLDEKTFCATIEAESSWNPNAKLVNKNGTTDWGICQFNDYWYKDLITPEKALNDPEFAIELMAKQWKKGRAMDWVAYKTGSYIKFLKNY